MKNRKSKSPYPPFSKGGEEFSFEFPPFQRGVGGGILSAALYFIVLVKKMSLVTP